MPPDSETVRVAGITPIDLLDILTLEEQQLVMQIVTKQDVSETDRNNLSKKFHETNEDLYVRTLREARAGARIVFWPEGSLLAFNDQDLEHWIQRGKILAREEGIYLGISLALIPDDNDRLNENKIVFIAPSGEVLYEYYKTQLIPEIEAPFTVKGDGVISSQITPYGRIAVVICYDMDNPRYISQVGAKRSDILFVPSGDWEAITPLHAKMAVFRAVEQGVSLLRPANHGLSVATDYQGRLLASMNHFTTEDRVLIAFIPIKGSRTIYSMIGDTFAWLCVFGGLGLPLLFWLRRFLANSKLAKDL